jgi:hypothetical protein
MKGLYEPPPPPIFMQPRPVAPMKIQAGESLPTFAALGAPAAGDAAAGSGGTKPHVDSSEVKAAADDAERLKGALEGVNISVTPNVNSESLSNTLNVAKQLLGVLNQIGAAGGRATTTVRGVAAGTHALHDGPEAH